MSKHKHDSKSEIGLEIHNAKNEIKDAIRELTAAKEEMREGLKEAKGALREIEDEFGIDLIKPVGAILRFVGKLVMLIVGKTFDEIQKEWEKEDDE